MTEVNYYNITTDDWKGTKLNFVGDETACNRLADKIIKIIANDPDEDIRTYSFDSSTTPMLHTATTVFLIDAALHPQQVKMAKNNKVMLVYMTYEEATGYYREQEELQATDYQILKLMEKYLVIPENDVDAIALLKRRANLRASLNLRAVKS